MQCLRKYLALLKARPTRLMFVLCWILGTAVLLIGLTMDNERAWNNHGFAMNLLSSLTAFLFGLPVAIAKSVDGFFARSMLGTVAMELGRPCRPQT
jgi:hypothetical protein